VPAGKTLAVLYGKTVTNEGTVIQFGTINANIPGYGVLTGRIIDGNRIVDSLAMHTKAVVGIRLYADETRQAPTLA